MGVVGKWCSTSTSPPPAHSTSDAMPAVKDTIEAGSEGTLRCLGSIITLL
jgi:hypothetical protein